MHVFFNCPMACEVWRRSGLHVVAAVHDSFAARLEDFFLHFDSPQLHVIAAVIVALWKVRNTALWEGVVAMPHGVWRSALAAWQQWEKAYDSSAADSMTNLVTHINPMPNSVNSKCLGLWGGWSPTTAQHEDADDERKETFGFLKSGASGRFTTDLSLGLGVCLSGLLVGFEPGMDPLARLYFN
nr:uncharacterized protein LOC109158421 [Ipomoea batatas]